MNKIKVCSCDYCKNVRYPNLKEDKTTWEYDAESDKLMCREGRLHKAMAKAQGLYVKFGNYD